MAWQETIEALKRNGETDESLYNLYTKAHLGDPSVLGQTVRLHNHNKDYMPMGAETVQEKFDDVMYALGKYFGDEEIQCENKGDLFIKQAEDNSLSPVDGDIKAGGGKSSIVTEITQLAQQPEGRALIGEFAQAVSSIFKGKKKEVTSVEQQDIETKSATDAATWKCSCGYDGNTRNFCEECGKPVPEQKRKPWKCSCGYAENTRNFCAECGKPKPKEETWECMECGTTNTRKFCPICGKPRP